MGVCVWLLDLSIAGSVWLLLVVAIVDAVLGTALGLFVSAFARTEFQAVQFMPARRDPAAPALRAVRAARPAACGARGGLDVLPLSYAVDAMQAVASSSARRCLAARLLIVAGFALAGLALGALTLRRQTA